MAQIKQFLTKTKPSDATSVFNYKPCIDSQSLEIFSLISISNEVDAETSKFNKFVWDGFIDGFLQEEGDVIKRLKHALIGAEFKLRELIKNDKVLKEKGVVLDLTAVVFKENKVYIAVLGDHKVWLYKNRVVDISKLLTENKSYVGSMFMSPGEFLLVYDSNKKLDNNVKQFEELENLLTQEFDEENARGGAFLAYLDPVQEESLEDIEYVQEEAVTSQSEENFEDFDEKRKGDLSFKFSVFKQRFITFLKNLSPFLGNAVRGSRKRLKNLSVENIRKNGKSIIVGEYQDRQTRVRRFIALGIFVILIVTLIIGVNSALQARESRVLSEEVGSLIEELEEKKDGIDEDNIDQSLNTLGDIQNDLDNYISELEEEGKVELLFEEDKEKLFGFETNIAETRDEILRITPFSKDKENFEMFLDAKLTFGDKSEPTDMIITSDEHLNQGEYIYMTDRGEKIVYEICVQTGDYTTMPDSDNLLSNPQYIDLGNARNTQEQAIFVYDFDQGILVSHRNDDMEWEDFEKISGLGARSLGGDDIGAIAAFGPNDDLAFLIPSEERVIRSQKVGEGNYALPGEYFSHSDLAKGYDLFGDQYIYVLSEVENGIVRFRPDGSEAELGFVDTFDDLQIVAGYTGVNMYRPFMIFDENTQRFVYFDKPIDIGEDARHPNEFKLQGQFEYRGERDEIFENVISIVNEQHDEYMFVLDGVKLWRINISLD